MYLIIALAGIVQGITGFGFALISVPVLSSFIPITTVVPAIVCFSTISNFLIVHKSIKYVVFKKIILMLIFGILGIPLGVYLLKYTNPILLTTLAGVLVIITGILMMRGYKQKFKSEKMAYSIAGLTSGVLNGSLSLSGPPIAFFLSNEGYSKDGFRANLTFYGIITNIIAILIYLQTGMLGANVLKLVFTGLISLFLGTYVGIILAKKISDNIFRNIVLVMLIVIGLLTVIKVIL